ncbi:hypothetical protein ACFLYU_04755 [Candidatus Dependentiae bacterium]
MRKKCIKVLCTISLFFGFATWAPLSYTTCSCSGSSVNCGECGLDEPTCCNSLCNGYPFLLPRSQGRNAARELVGCQEFMNKYDMGSKYGYFSVAVEYQRSFWAQQIPRYYFGQDYIECKYLKIQGSKVANRDRRAWLADYFGLPPDYDSRVSFCPRVQNAIVDLNLYYGLDSVTEGLYVKVVAPIVWTKWELNPCEKICTDGIQSFSAGYMAEDEVTRENLSKNFLQFMSGNYTFGDMKTPIKYGLMSCHKCTTKTRLSELRASLGYNFVLDKDYHFGFFFQVSAPLGNRPCAKYLFEPIVGNGKHWEIGGGLSGSWIFNQCEDNPERYMGIWIDMTLTHLIKSCQRRSFDILCKSNSRYMLLEQLDTNEKDLKIVYDGESIVANLQYKKNLIPAINWSTFRTDVRIDLQTDIAIKLGFVRNNSSFDIGYNFWARSGEKFARECRCTCEPTCKYAVKGDTFVYGYYGGAQENSIPLSATQSEASIHSGKNHPAFLLDPTNPIDTNPSIDNKNPDGYNTYSQANPLVAKGSTEPVNTSIQPILLSQANINLQDSPSALTHKIFAHFGYAWKNDIDNENNNNGIPFVGFGGEIEFARNRCKIECHSCNKKQCYSCNSCSCQDTYYACDYCCDKHCGKRMGISQWGVWLKGGVAFN